ncbi:WG repeat-containing protein [Hymenobacter nivis]|uniref:WG repeat-containing protein n=1 Tax=Hymenobacter nivis TaxID=1850093 RepID=A0A502GZR5_9BACT|nr:WG repeat-containing protein [Hymenobacter nivis]
MLTIILLTACRPAPPLCLVVRERDDACAYVAAPGDTVIPFGRYSTAATKRFDRLALVLKPGVGWVGINRQEQVLFRAYLFDNGPDYPAEGLMRIVSATGLIGYADTATGRVVLPPRYEAAFPFDSGRAQVGSRCRSETDGEHSWWRCAEWHYIDHEGRPVPPALP